MSKKNPSKKEIKRYLKQLNRVENPVRKVSDQLFQQAHDLMLRQIDYLFLNGDTNEGNKDSRP